MKKHVNSVYLVAQYLLANKKSYICDIKKKCKANNPMSRIMSLRKSFNWHIDTIFEGWDGKCKIYHYRLKKAGKMPSQFL